MRRRRGADRIVLVFVIVATVCVISDVASGVPLWNYRHIFINVANNDGVKYDMDGALYGGGNNNTYFIKFEGTGVNELHIANAAPTGDNYGEVTTSSSQSGTFYVSNTGGRGFDNDIVLLLAVNGTISDDFSVHIRSSGYNWTPAPLANTTPPPPTDYQYIDGAVDETFTKTDFIYGPQIWKPGPDNYPLFYGQDMGNSSNTFQLMFIDLYVGNMKPSTFPSVTLTDGGAAKVEYSFNHLTTYAVFNGYGWTSAANQGQGISWTNRITDPGGPSGYSVIGVTAPTPIPLPGYTNPPTDPDGDGIYEDLNGNGRKDFNDVFVFFKQMSWISANEPVSLFDYNGNGRIDFNDIFLAFKEI